MPRAGGPSRSCVRPMAARRSPRGPPAPLHRTCHVLRWGAYTKWSLRRTPAPSDARCHTVPHTVELYIGRVTRVDVIARSFDDSPEAQRTLTRTRASGNEKLVSTRTSNAGLRTRARGESRKQATVLRRSWDLRASVSSTEVRWMHIFGTMRILVVTVCRSLMRTP